MSSSPLLFYKYIVQIMRKISSFTILNAIQFCAAINENLFKLLSAYFLIYVLGEKSADSIMEKVGMIFILPFLLFSSLGGIFADRFSKNRMIIITRSLELTCLLFALFFFTNSLYTSAYILLFFMATFSAIFGPCKYGIIPELTAPSKLLYANSIIASFTYIGIIIGTALPSLVVWITDNNYKIALLSSVFLAIIGLFLSFFLPKTPVENKEKTFRIFIYMELIDGLKQMWKIPSLFSAAFAFSYFLFIGGFVQLNLIPYSIHILGLSDIAGGYFFLITALGLGLGSFLTHTISKEKIHLKFVPFSGMGISLILCLFIFTASFWQLVAILLFILGFLGGILIVPPQAFILFASPKEDRGRNFATANFFSFAFALYLLNTLLALNPAQSFFVIGIVNFVVMLILLKSINKAKQAA